LANEIISGVGKMSRRTDKNISSRTTQGAKEIPSTKYGERKMLNELQTSAPMQGASAKTPRISATQPAAPVEKVIPLFSETTRIDEIPETGMPFGEGPGPEILGITPQGGRTVSQILADAAQYDPTGEINAIYEDSLLKGF
jgi:hypothetical protein